MSSPTLHPFEVRFPNGDAVTLHAAFLFTDAAVIGLKTNTGDNPGNFVFVASHQSGVTITRVEEPEPERKVDHLDPIRRLFTRRWICDVRASGMHNGADCDPDDPHDDRCRYLWTARITDNVARVLGITDEKETTS